MPPAIASRPRDPRGYPVPAITPWENGVPQFASLSMRRVFLCVTQRRCTVCGLEVPPGSLWRVVDTEETEMLAEVLAAGIGGKFQNAAPTQEGPGHRLCMIYSAMICPFLGGPEARRSQGADTYGEQIPRGEARGQKGGIVAYDGCEFRSTPVGPGVVYGHPLDLIEYERGEDLLDELERSLEDDTSAGIGSCPPWLLDDEAAVDAAFNRAMRGPEEEARIRADRRAAQERRKRQKQAKASRRRNR